MSGLLAFISRSVCIDMYHKIVMSSFSDTVSGSCSYNFDFVLMLNSLEMFQCRYVAALLCLQYVDIQFWPAQEILPQYGQWFPGIDHISDTLSSLLKTSAWLVTVIFNYNNNNYDLLTAFLQSSSTSFIWN